MTRFADAAKIKAYKMNSLNTFEEINLILGQSISESYMSPVFLEISSYRLFEHCGHHVDTNNGDRTTTEYSNFERKDPITNEIQRNIRHKKLFDETFNSIINMCTSIEASL